MDRRARGLAVSFLVRRKLAESSVTHTRAAEAIGVSRQRFEAILDEGLLQADDLVCLEPLAPGPLGAWGSGRGLTVTPERPHGTATDILAGLAETMARVGALTSETTTALPDGINRREAARIDLACEQARRAVNELQARVDAGVVGR